METYNPQVLPSSVPKKDHHKTAMMALWAALGAIIIGLLYWWMVSREMISAPLSLPHTETEKERLVRSVNSEPVAPLSDSEVKAKATLVSQTSNEKPKKLTPEQMAAKQQLVQSTQ